MSRERLLVLGFITLTLQCAGAAAAALCPMVGCKRCNPVSGCLECLGGFLIVKNNSGTSKCRRRPVASPPPPQRIQQKPVPSPVYAGSAAPYSAALTSASKLACGYPVLSPWQGTNFAAINAAQWDGGSQCGRCGTVRCTDARCQKVEAVPVVFLDLCADCKYGEIDLSDDAFLAASGGLMAFDRLTVQWNFSETCAPFTAGGIRLDPRSVNPWRQELYLYNAAESIAAAELDGRQLSLAGRGFWVSDTSASPVYPSTLHTLVVTSDQGTKASVILRDLGQSRELPVQFGSGNGWLLPKPSPPPPSPSPSPSPPPPSPRPSPPPPIRRPPSPPPRSPPPSPPPPSPPPPPPRPPPSPSPNSGGPIPIGSVYSGQATAYSPPVTSGNNFACAYPVLSPWQRVYFVAISLPQWDGAKQCGRCVMAKCVDSRCRVRNKYVVAQVMDQCATWDCKLGNLDFSNQAFLELTGLSPDRVKIEWQFTSCTPYTAGNIRLDPKSVSVWWQELFIYNSAEPIASVSINGRAMKLDTWGFWVNDASSAPVYSGKPIVFSITSDSGRTLTATVTDLKARDLGVQFR